MCWQIKNNTLYYSMLSLGNVYFLLFVFSSIWLNAKTNFIVTLKSCVQQKKLCDKHKNPLCIAHKKVVWQHKKNIVNQNNTNVISHT